MAKAKYSFFNLCTINMGTMVGVGIFFKNTGILRDTNNIWIAIVAWLVGLVLVYGITLAFAEASSATTKKGMSGTLSNWASLFIGEKTGLVVHQVMSWVYYPFFSVLLVYYAVYFVYEGAGNYAGANWIVYLGVTLAAYFALCVGNALSLGFGKALQAVGTVVKFIPLVGVIFVGFFAPAVSSSANAFAGVVNPSKDALTTVTQTWHWSSIFAALPGVFFAFDAFIGGLALSKEESKKGDAFKASLFSVVVVGIFYVVFAAAVGWGTNNGSLFDLFTNAFGPKARQVIFFVIGLSAYTVANGMTVAGARQVKATADEKAFVKINSITKIESDGRFYGQTINIFFVGSLYCLALFLTAVAKYPATVAALTADKAAGYTIMKEIESVIDNYGNAVTLFGFWFYAIVTVGVWVNRHTKRHAVDKQKWPLLWFIASFVVGWVVVLSTVRWIKGGGVLQTLIFLGLFIVYFTSKIGSLHRGHYE